MSFSWRRSKNCSASEERRQSSHLLSTTLLLYRINVYIFFSFSKYFWKRVFEKTLAWVLYEQRGTKNVQMAKKWPHQLTRSYSGFCHTALGLFFFIFITSPGGVSKSTIFANHNLISVRHRKYRLIILLYLHVISCSSTLDLLFFSGSGASTLARELEPLRP